MARDNLKGQRGRIARDGGGRRRAGKPHRQRIARRQFRRARDPRNPRNLAHAAPSIVTEDPVTMMRQPSGRGPGDGSNQKGLPHELNRSVA